MNLKDLEPRCCYLHAGRAKIVQLIACGPEDGASLIVEPLDSDGDVMGGDLFRCEACELSELTNEIWSRYFPSAPMPVVTTKDAKVAKELPEGFDVLAAAAASETREIQKKISLLCMGRDVRHTFAAMALEISACEGMMGLTPACFDSILAIMRGNIGKAKAMAEAARGNN